MLKSSLLMIGATLAVGAALAKAIRYGNTYGEQPGNIHLGSAIGVLIPLILALGFIVTIWFILSRRDDRPNQPVGELGPAVVCVLSVIGSVVCATLGGYYSTIGNHGTRLAFGICAGVLILNYMRGMVKLTVT